MATYESCELATVKDSQTPYTPTNRTSSLLVSAMASSHRSNVYKLSCYRTGTTMATDWAHNTAPFHDHRLPTLSRAEPAHERTKEPPYLRRTCGEERSRPLLVVSAIDWTSTFLHSSGGSVVKDKNIQTQPRYPWLLPLLRIVGL